MGHQNHMAHFRQPQFIISLTHTYTPSLSSLSRAHMRTNIQTHIHTIHTYMHTHSLSLSRSLSLSLHLSLSLFLYLSLSPPLMMALLFRSTLHKWLDQILPQAIVWELYCKNQGCGENMASTSWSARKERQAGNLSFCKYGPSKQTVLKGTEAPQAD